MLRASTAQASPPAVLFVIYQTDMRANGGIESICRVLEGLERVRASVFTQRDGPFTRRLAENVCALHLEPMRRGLGRRPDVIARRLFGLLRSNVSVASKVLRHGVGVVHCNDPVAFWHAALGARAAGARVVFNVRDIKDPATPYGFKWRLTRHLAHHTLLLSRDMRDAFDARVPPLLGSGSSLGHIYSIVDCDDRTPTRDEKNALRERLGLCADDFLVVLVGAMRPKKDQRGFIEHVAPRLRSACPRTKVLLLGDDRGDYAARCRARIADLDLTDTLLLRGFQEDMDDWYRAVDVTVIASRHEGLARCMIESLARGTPVVSFDVSSAHEILGAHECGRVVPRGDYARLADELLALAKDPAECRRLAEAGLTTARDLFDARRVCERYEQFYRALPDRRAHEIAAD